MEIMIEPVTNDEDEAAMGRIRQQVFEREMGIALARFAVLDSSSSFHLLARVKRTGETVAALSVVNTSGDDELHEGYGLKFSSVARVARYRQLAVLRPYRGLNIPLRLMLEAHRRFVAPGKFDYTWLLFDAERAASSLMCKWLAFMPGERAFATEYGRSRTLLRDESTPRSAQAIWRTEQHVWQMMKLSSATNQVFMSPAHSA
jgi:hypothetical protein